MNISGLFIENFHLARLLGPVADIYNGNPACGPVNIKNYKKAVFLLANITAGSNTGVANVKMQAVDNAAGSNAANIEFWYSSMTTATDTMGSPTKAVAANGFNTTANVSTIYVIEVDAADMPESQTWVQMKLTESVNDPVTGAVIFLGGNPRYGYPFSTVLS